VTLQQPSADTESEKDAPDDETEDSIVEVQEPHKRQHQQTRSPDVQLEHRGEPVYIPTEHTEERWMPGVDRQQGNAVAFGNSGCISHAADANSTEDRYLPGIPRARSFEPRGLSRPRVVPSEGDTSRSRSRIQGGYPSCGDEEGWRRPKALGRSRSGFRNGNPGEDSRDREFFDQAPGQSRGLRVDKNNTLGQRRRSSSVDESHRDRNDACAQEARRWIGPSPNMDPCMQMPQFDGSGDLE